MAKPLPLEITPKEVKRLLDKSKGLRLVDVREPVEFEAARHSLLRNELQRVEVQVALGIGSPLARTP